MSADQFRLLIERGDADGIRRALEANPSLANQTIHWHLNQKNESDPLHYVSDCVGHGWLRDSKAGEIASLLLASGAEINGSKGRETPLIASTSLGAEAVAKVLVEAGRSWRPLPFSVRARCIGRLGLESPRPLNY